MNRGGALLGWPACVVLIGEVKLSIDASTASRRSRRGSGCRCDLARRDPRSLVGRDQSIQTPRSTSNAAHRDDRARLLVGEVKLSLDAADVRRQLHALEAKTRACDWARNKQLTLRLWTLRRQGRSRRPPAVIDARELHASWRAASVA